MCLQVISMVDSFGGYAKTKPAECLSSIHCDLISDFMRSEPQSNEKILRVLQRRELPVDTTELTRYLIGKTLVHDLPEGRVSGRIVETEAYPIGDAAAHAFRGLTARNRSLFLPRGHSFVYFAYGSSWMMNVSSEAAGVGAGVLIRALEPLDGIAILSRNRGVSRLVDLFRGPGRLAER